MFNVNCKFRDDDNECLHPVCPSGDCHMTSNKSVCNWIIPNKRPNLDPVQSGVELISLERTRQIESEGWTPGHDDAHFDGSLAMVAACYASPKHLYAMNQANKSIQFYDLWPIGWSSQWEKKTEQSRKRQLVIAGALIAAEIDRLSRAASKDIQVTPPGIMKNTRSG